MGTGRSCTRTPSKPSDVWDTHSSSPRSVRGRMRSLASNRMIRWRSTAPGSHRERSRPVGRVRDGRIPVEVTPRDREKEASPKPAFAIAVARRDERDPARTDRRKRGSSPNSSASERSPNPGASSAKLYPPYGSSRFAVLLPRVEVVTGPGRARRSLRSPRERKPRR